MIKIVHVVYRFHTGGLENGVVNLINHLKEDEYHHTIVSMTEHDPGFVSRIKTNNVTFVDLHKKTGQDFGVFWRLNRLLKTIKPHVLHTRNTASIETQFIGWWRRVPLRIHGEHGWDVNDMNGSNVRYQKLRRVLKPFIHEFVALSSEAKDYLLEKIHVPPDKINHICNGVDHTKFYPDKQDNNHFVFGCVGRLEVVKNHVLLAEAFVKVWQHCQNHGHKVELHLVGDGSCRSKVEAIIDAAGCHDNVWMAGNRNDVAGLMRHFNVFVLPSLVEGISNTILEAMASGVPIVATDVGGNGELVVDGESGYLVDVDNAEQMAERMIKYVENTNVARLHGCKSRELVEQKFSIDAMTSSYDKLYRNLKKQ